MAPFQKITDAYTQRMAVEQRGAALDLAGVEAQEQQLQASLQENAREALMATFCAPAREAASSMQQYQHAQQPHQSRLADQQAHIQASAGNVQQPLPSSRLAGPAPSMQVPTAALDIAASQLDEEILTEQPAFCILAHRSMQRGRRSELEYLVHFPGYADEQDVWENASRQPLQAGGDEPTDAEACTAEEAAAAAWGRARQASGRSPQDRGLDYAPRPAFPGSQAAPRNVQHAPATQPAQATREAEVIDVSSPAAPQTDGGMPAIARNAVGAGPGQKRGAVPIAGAGPSWESPAPEATAPSIKQERAAPGTERRGSATNGSDRERDAAGGQGPAAGRPPITLKQEHLVEPAGGSTLVDNDQFIDAREDTPSDDEALEEEMRLQALLAAVKPETMRRLDEGWERAMITGARKEGGSLRLRVVWIETPEYEDYVDLLVLRSKPQCRVELIDFFVTKIKPSNPRRSRRTSGEEGDQPVTVE
ncbi:hypothetical protein WJX72_002700 [[Myrmecia] bisecta]|uniref:Chromo domain-containing protein n=1 Tax=[Myrmecia] bisecta TaxID=41462 RepID=A0AAW1QBB3_9CHLO